MPTARYIKVTIDDEQIDLNSIEEVPVALSYKLEDREDFQKKKSSDALSITIPASLRNDRISNTFHNPSVEDNTTGGAYKSARRANIEANSYELLNGKAFLSEAAHTNRPIAYEYDFYGNNADWMVDLQESTLFDFLKHITFTFSRDTIVNSWQFDGTSESLPYVFAPVRYGQPMEEAPANLVQNPPAVIKDYNMKAEYMKPAISKYWLLYWGFKSLGYRIQSTFLDTPFFRRQVMPWTWGNFLFSEGTRLENLKFLAKSTEASGVWNYSYTGYWDARVSNDSNNGGFDNNGVYTYDAGAKEMKWTYLNNFNYGALEAAFVLKINVDATATANSDVELRVHWFKNGVQFADTALIQLNAPTIGRKDFIGMVEDNKTVNVVATDVVSAKIYIHTFDSGTGRANISVNVEEFSNPFFRIPANGGGIIDFQNYTGLKKYKFLDYLKGVADESNLAIQTDSISKVVLIEPTHPYSLTNDFSVKAPGYFNEDYIDWSQKQDVLKESKLTLFKDSERELLFKYKSDSNDGMLKKVQDRDNTTVGTGKYVLPSRFKTGKKEAVENRFFSAVMHYDVEQWKGITGIAPQMVCLVPENISNTSKDEAQNTFSPKSCYYKGLVNGWGWRFDNETKGEFPFMFAVNYKPGGENDPILSYSDEKIGTGPTFVIGKGLLRRFFLQRMAIMRNGQYYETNFKLNNLDITNWFHREHIICRGQRWELVEINNYKPLKEESTECFLRRWVPAEQVDGENVFPASAAILNTGSLSSFDIKYSQLKCLASDIPTV